MRKSVFMGGVIVVRLCLQTDGSQRASPAHSSEGSLAEGKGRRGSAPDQAHCLPPRCS